MKDTFIREGFISVRGGRVWYRIIGKGGKTPLLLLHGGPGGTHDYLEPLSALSDERPVVMYDQLGSGNSDRPDDLSLWTIERFVDELRIVREALDLKDVHILGQSWGAMLATSYLLMKKPQGVLSMVLSGPYLSSTDWAADQRTNLSRFPADVRDAVATAEKSGDFQSQAYQDATMAYYNVHLCRMKPWPDCINRTFEKMGQALYLHMWGPTEFSITGTLKDRDITAGLGNLGVPVLYTCGRHDEAAPTTVERYHQLTPRSEIMVFEDASHSHHLEKQDAFLRTVREFLRRTANP